MNRVVTDSTSCNSNSEIKKVLETTGVQCLENRESSKDYPVHNTAAVAWWLSPFKASRRGSGATPNSKNHGGAAAADFQPRWTSMGEIQIKDYF
mgnify:CR=1 FL=1